MTALREIRADYDDNSIIVYQAFGSHIADTALQHQKFVPPFSMSRMTWIKPSFLWMMARCNWATKSNQDRVLAIRITRTGWEEALSEAVLSTDRILGAKVVVQWDPERDINGQKLAYRSIQVGLSPDIVQQYINSWTLSIDDMTSFAHKLAALVHDGQSNRVRQLLPHERIYPAPLSIKRRLGM